MAVHNVVVTKQIDPEKVEILYYKLLSEFEGENANRAEVSAAAAVFLGTQWNGAVMNDDQTRVFIQDLTQWLAAYFVKGTVQ